jgi:hypothetical protein
MGKLMKIRSTYAMDIPTLKRVASYRQIVRKRARERFFTYAIVSGGFLAAAIVYAMRVP